MTAEDWAPYGYGGEPDADGWYPNYRTPPAHLRPSMATSTVEQSKPADDIDTSLYALVTNWRYVVADLIERGIDLYDPAVRARPWPGVRTAIFALIDTPGTRLREALTRR